MYIDEVVFSICELIASIQPCQLKKKTPKRGLVVRPILAGCMNSRCQVDLIDVQSEPDGCYRTDATAVDPHPTCDEIVRLCLEFADEMVASG